ncbi:MAG TPA: hypothetical protein VKA69_06400, partial [Desulfobacteria bacterium]|nr:hypothetical protein [Desulfobacteria bacterium]
MMNAKVKTGCTVCLCWVLASLFTWNFTAHAAVKEAPKEKQIERIESKLSEEASKFNAFQSKEAQLLTLVADLEKQIAESKKETEALRLNVRDVRERLDGEKIKLKKLKSTLMGTELQIGEYLIALYKFSRRTNIHILANAELLSGLQRNIKYIGIVTEKDRMKLRSLTQRASVCHDEIAKTEASIDATERVVKEKTSRLVFLETSLEEKILLLMKVHGEKEFYETSVEELETAVGNLKQALDPTVDQNSYDIDPSLNFEDCKGKLPLPIQGKIIRSRGKMDAAFSGAKGVVILAGADKAVRSVFR